MAEAPDSFQAQHVHPHQGAQQVLAPAKEKMSPSAQLEKYGFNIDESLATSYVGKYTLYHTIGQGAFGK